MTVQVVCSDVLDWAASYAGPPFHAILTDPPYELGFMGKSWDASGVAFQSATWAALTVHLLPGAHVLAFGGGRTHHRLMCAMEDAGLEIRDCIYWAFGQGFPKSANVSKHLDRMAKADRQVIGTQDVGPDMRGDNYQRANGRMVANLTAPATPAAATWEGYGSALKPAVEVICMARKPIDGTIAANCERYGSGALAIDACRISANDVDDVKPFGCMPANKTDGNGFTRPWMDDKQSILDKQEAAIDRLQRMGRWPANLVLDDSEAVVGLFPANAPSGGRNGKVAHKWTAKGRAGIAVETPSPREPDEGSAARYFYQATWELDQAEQLDAADVLRYAAKASRAERDAGLEGFEPQSNAERDGRNQYKNGNALNGSGKLINGTGHITPPHNHHPTVKPLSLCRYLAMLLLPPAAYAPRRILVPFGGVASEAIGVMLAGWDEVVMVEREREYCDIAEARVAYWQGKMDKQIALPLEVLA